MSKVRKYWREIGESRILFFQEKVEGGYDLQKDDTVELMLGSPEASKNVRSISKKKYRVTDTVQYQGIGEADIKIEEIEDKERKNGDDTE